VPLAANTPPDPLVLIGRVVTFDDAQPVLEHGAVYIGADEHIHAVQDASKPGPEGFRRRT
jgi:cell wall-associated NlpC family hydrolase